MNCYCDSSFFLPQLYPSQRRLDALQQADEIEAALGFVPITTLTRFEVIQALQFEAWLKKNDKSKGMSINRVHDALNLLSAELGDLYRIVPVNWDAAFERAEAMTRSTPDNGWRTMDILHVAAALTLRAKTFCSFYQKQNDLARLEGMATPLANLAET